jgi:uncharacterized RDD family membrane protein YckC
MNDMLGSRRLVAFLIDCLIFLGIAIAVLYPLTRLDGDRFRIGSPLPEIFSSSTARTVNGKTTAEISGTWIAATCAEPETVPEAVLGALEPVQVRRVLVCADTFLGLASGHTTRVDYFAGEVVTGTDGNTRISAIKRDSPVSFSVSTDAQGNPVRALFPIGLLTFGLMFAVAAKGWSTPGKLLTGLRVESVDGTCRVCREFRRLGPFLLAAGFALVTGFFGAEIAASPTLQSANLVLTIAFWIFVLWYYAVPFMTDAGRARYDWSTKFRVVLA